MSISIATSGGKEGFLWDQQYTKTSTLIITDPQPIEDRGILSPQQSIHCLKTSILLPCLFHMIFSLFYGENEITCVNTPALSDTFLAF